MNYKGADQSARTRRLICAFVVRTCIKASFFSAVHMKTNKSHYFMLISQWRTNIQIWSTFLRGLIQNSIEVKATVSKTARATKNDLSLTRTQFGYIQHSVKPVSVVLLVFVISCIIYIVHKTDIC